MVKFLLLQKIDDNQFNMLFKMFKLFIINVAIKTKKEVCRTYLQQMHLLFEQVFTQKEGIYQFENCLQFYGSDMEAEKEARKVNQE